MIKQKDNYIYVINGNEYDIRNVDDELYIMQEIEKEKNKNEIQKVFQEFTDKKVGLMAIPLFPKALQNADYVVLTTLLDEKFSNYDVVNKPNYRIINRQSYLKNKEEMLKSTGNLEKVLYTEEKSKKEEDLLKEYKEIAVRRVKLGLLLSEVGQDAKVSIKPEDINAAIMNEARKYPGQEQMVLDYYLKNKQAVEALKAPIFEEKIIDHILSLAKLNEKDDK